MSTCNFKTMKDFDLWVIDEEKMCEFYLGEEYKKENGIEEYSYDDIDLAYDLLREDFNDDSGIDKLNDSLQWYNVELRSGYYEGLQIYIDTEWSGINEYADWLPSKPLIWDDEECELQFGLTREETIKMIEEEKKKINEFLENTKYYGFYKIKCIGVFSNGEAVYQLA